MDDLYLYFLYNFLSEFTSVFIAIFSKLGFLSDKKTKAIKRAYPVSFPVGAYKKTWTENGGIEIELLNVDDCPWNCVSNY